MAQSKSQSLGAREANGQLSVQGQRAENPEGGWVSARVQSQRTWSSDIQGQQKMGVLTQERKNSPFLCLFILSRSPAD